MKFKNLKIITLFSSIIFTLSFAVKVPTSLASQTATISVNPTSGSYSVGVPFSVSVVIDGGGQSFNAAQATVSVSGNLSVQSLTNGNCNFAYPGQAPSTSNPSFSGAILGGSSTNCIVYSMSILPTSAGTGTITLSSGSVKSSTDSSEILSSLNSATYTLNIIPFPVYRFWNAITNEHFYTSNPGERLNIIANDSSIWTYEGIVFSTYTSQAQNTIPVYRFWSPNLRTHLYTADQNEYNTIVSTESNIWNYEGISYYAYSSQQQNTIPVYRLYNPTLYTHLYTTDANEKNVLSANGWNYEGVAYYVYQYQGDYTFPVYRFWSNALSTHFYTSSPTEKNSLIANASSLWSFEGPAFYAYTYQATNTIPIYRFYSAQYNTHFFTADENEKNSLINNAGGLWSFEGVAFYEYPTAYNGASNPVYRFASKLNHEHFYTQDVNEKNSLVSNYSNIWTYEGASWNSPQS